MPQITAGASATYTSTVRGMMLVLSVNGASIVDVSGRYSASLGPLPQRRAFGPLEIGESLTVSCVAGSCAVEFADIDPGVMGDFQPQPPGAGGGAAPTAVSSSQIIADAAPASPGTWPNLTTYYISDSGAGVDPGTQVVWIPTSHATLPAGKGWRFAFYPSATVL